MSLSVVEGGDSLFLLMLHFMPSGWDPPHPLLAFMDIWSKLVPLEWAHFTLPADVDSFAFQKFAGTYFQVCVCVHIHCTFHKWRWEAIIVMGGG